MSALSKPNTTRPLIEGQSDYINILTVLAVLTVLSALTNYLLCLQDVKSCVKLGPMPSFELQEVTNLSHIALTERFNMPMTIALATPIPKMKTLLSELTPVFPASHPTHTHKKYAACAIEFRHSLHLHPSTGYESGHAQCPLACRVAALPG